MCFNSVKASSFFLCNFTLHQEQAGLDIGKKIPRSRFSDLSEEKCFCWLQNGKMPLMV